MCTVHLWNASYVLFMFLLGSGMWMFEHRNGVAAATYGARKSHLARVTSRKGTHVRDKIDIAYAVGVGDHGRTFA